MFLRYLAVFSVFTLRNVDCYNPNRQQRLTSVKNSNNPEVVIPARYKIKNSQTNEPSFAENIHADNFPEVEYPTSILDSSKPFYVNISPFSNDVKSSFKSFALGGTTKATPTIVLNLKPKENVKEKIESKTPTSQILNVNETTISKGNEINLKDKGRNETVCEEPISDSENDTGCFESQLHTDKQLFNFSHIEPNDYEEIEYVIGMIDDLDDFITAVTAIETEYIDMNNCTTTMFDSERPKEFATITSDVTSGNNESVTELNDGSLHTEPNLLFDDDSSSTHISLVNKGITNTGFSDETEGEFSSIVSIPNDDYSS